jgi:hypothetical protein
MQSVTGKGVVSGVQVEATDITKLTQKEKKVSGTFRHEKDDDFAGVPGLCPLSVPVLRGEVRKGNPGQTGDGDMRLSEQNGGTGMIAHCNSCARAGFRPAHFEWEDPRYVALRALAVIKLEKRFERHELDSIDSVFKIINQSVFRDEAARLNKVEARC